MTYKENITAILECCFAGFKEEIIEASFVEKCIGRKLTYIEKYLLLKDINTKP